jgi:hypothetical protein
MPDVIMLFSFYPFEAFKRVPDFQYSSFDSNFQFNKVNQIKANPTNQINIPSGIPIYSPLLNRRWSSAVIMGGYDVWLISYFLHLPFTLATDWQHVHLVLKPVP